MADEWIKAEGAEKDESGNYVGKINGLWVPVSAAAKDDAGNYLVKPIGQTTGTSAANADEPFMEEARKIASTTPAEAIAGNPVTRFALGAAEPIIGAAQKAAWHFPSISGSVNAHLKALDQMRSKGMEAYGDKIDVAGTAGNFLSPVSLTLAKLMPSGPLMTKVGAGGALGVAGGATAPIYTDPGRDEFAKETMAQGGMGGLIGAGITAAAPIIGMTAKFAHKNFIEPLLNPAAIKGRAFLEAAGDKADEIIALLRQNKEIVPGSAPTAGEAATPAGSTGFSALQKSASTVPGVADQYVARKDAQNAARIAQVRTVGEDEAALEAANSFRAKNAVAGYDPIRFQFVKPDSTFDMLMKRPSMQSALNEAKSAAQERSSYFPTTADDPYTIENMQRVKQALDDMIKNPQKGLGKTQAKEIGETRDIFVKWLSEKSPEWKNARLTYRIDSQPIEQMKVGQYLERRLVPALSENAQQKAASYSSALDDAPGTIKRSTGEARYSKLDEILLPNQVKAVESVRDDLARGARLDQLAKDGIKGGTSASGIGTGSMEEPIGGKIPNVLNRSMMVTNAIIARVGGNINKKLAIEIAVDMLNPPGVAETMAQAQKRFVRNSIIAKATDEMMGATVVSTANIIEKRK